MKKVNLLRCVKPKNCHYHLIRESLVRQRRVAESRHSSDIPRSKCGIDNLQMVISSKKVNDIPLLQAKSQEASGMTAINGTLVRVNIQNQSECIISLFSH